MIISRSGADLVTGGGDFEGNSIQTLRVYPTHESDHFFGAKDPLDTLQCTKYLDATMMTNFELVLDDLWYPDAKYTNEDDFCSVLVHGWELEWYWDNYEGADCVPMAEMLDGTDLVSDAVTCTNNMVDIWFSRETGQADFCLSSSATECNGPDDSAEDFCITYWVKCDPKPYSSPSTVEADLVSDAWSSWFGW